jgi:hypothetical protein
MKKYEHRNGRKWYVPEATQITKQEFAKTTLYQSRHLSLYIHYNFFKGFLASTSNKLTRKRHHPINRPIRDLQSG